MGMNRVLVGQNQGTTLQKAHACASLLMEILLQGFNQKKNFFGQLRRRDDTAELSQVSDFVITFNPPRWSKLIWPLGVCASRNGRLSES
jgi:hypothetical protein